MVNKSVGLKEENWKFLMEIKKEFKISSIDSLIGFIIPHIRTILEKEGVLKRRLKEDVNQ